MRKFFVGSLLLGLFTYFFLFDSLKDDAEDIDFARLFHMETALTIDSKEVSKNKKYFLDKIADEIKTINGIDTSSSIIDILKNDKKFSYKEFDVIKKSGAAVFPVEFTVNESSKCQILFIGVDKNIQSSTQGKVYSVEYRGPSISNNSAINIAHFVYGISSNICRKLEKLYPRMGQGSDIYDFYYRILDDLRMYDKDVASKSPSVSMQESTNKEFYIPEDKPKICENKIIGNKDYKGVLRSVFVEYHVSYLTIDTGEDESLTFAFPYGDFAKYQAIIGKSVYVHTETRQFEDPDGDCVVEVWVNKVSLQ